VDALAVRVGVISQFFVPFAVGFYFVFEALEPLVDYFLGFSFFCILLFECRIGYNWAFFSA
jgi:hypothetical protein